MVCEECYNWIYNRIEYSIIEYSIIEYNGM